MPRRSSKSTSRRNVKRLRRSSRLPKQKTRGGSPASERVMKLVPKQCNTFVNSTSKSTVQPIREDYGGYAIQAGGGEDGSSSNSLQGSCPNTNSFIPHNSDSYYRWRGNEGDSNAFGSSVPSNMFQHTSDWFNGKKTLFTPSKFDASVQNEAQYFTDKGNGAMLNMPKLMNKKVEVPMGIIGDEAVHVSTFDNSYNELKTNSNVTIPMARAGRKKRRNLTRRARRNTRRSNLQRLRR